MSCFIYWKYFMSFDSFLYRKRECISEYGSWKYITTECVYLFWIHSSSAWIQKEWIYHYWTGYNLIILYNNSINFPIWIYARYNGSRFFFWSNSSRFLFWIIICNQYIDSSNKHKKDPRKDSCKAKCFFHIYKVGK